ncbi:hypothetical protein ACO3TA_07275 [Methanocaldococcus sp. 28A]
MEKVYSKFGRVDDLKEIISGLANFTGIIRIDNALLYYINSKLISSKLNGREKSLEEIFSQIPDEFLIEIYVGDEKEIKYALKNFKPDESIVEVSKLSLVFDNSFILNSYNDIYKYITSIDKVVFIPKRFKNEKAVVIYKNKREIFAVYFGKKILFGKKAISKLKTTFAVSEMIAKIEKISNEELNSLKRKYPEGVLLFGESLNDVIKKITSSKEAIILENTSLMDALSNGTCLIRIEGSEEGYIIAKEGKPTYAFLKDFDGEKSYRLLKSMCIVEDVKYYIYKLSKEEYDMFKAFQENRITF